jgi:hypothetical protein
VLPRRRPLLFASHVPQKLPAPPLPIATQSFLPLPLLAPFLPPVGGAPSFAPQRPLQDPSSATFGLTSSVYEPDRRTCLVLSPSPAGPVGGGSALRTALWLHEHRRTATARRNAGTRKLAGRLAPAHVGRDAASAPGGAQQAQSLFSLRTSGCGLRACQGTENLGMDRNSEPPLIGKIRREERWGA